MVVFQCFFAKMHATQAGSMISTYLHALLGPCMCRKGVKKSVWDVFGRSSEASCALWGSLGRTLGVLWGSLVGFGGVLGGLVGPWGGLNCKIFIFASRTKGPEPGDKVRGGCREGARGVQGGCKEGARRVQGGCESLRGWLGEVIRHFKGSPGRHIKRRREEDLATGEREMEEGKRQRRRRRR